MNSDVDCCVEADSVANTVWENDVQCTAERERILGAINYWHTHLRALMHLKGKRFEPIL